MCGVDRGKRLKPLTQNHARHLATLYPEQKAFIGELTDVLLEGLNPFYNVLPLFTLMKEYIERGRYGLAGEIWGNALRFPLAVVVPETGARYRTPTLEQMHESVLSLNMSEATMRRVRKVFEAHGLQLHTMCSCGIFLAETKAKIDFVNDPIVQKMDRYRSSLDALGRPVIAVNMAEDIPGKNMDWTATDVQLHNELNQLIDALAEAVPYDEGRFNAERDVAAMGQDLRLRADLARSARPTTSPSNFVSA